MDSSSAVFPSPGVATLLRRTYSITGNKRDSTLLCHIYLVTASAAFKKKVWEQHVYCGDLGLAIGSSVLYCTAAGFHNLWDYLSLFVRLPAGHFREHIVRVVAQLLHVLNTIDSASDRCSLIGEIEPYSYTNRSVSL
jgi:hypothetical protein